jgi:ketosteroid isomerase-like protein
VADDPVKLLAAALRALNARDMDGLRRLMHEDMEWRPALTAGGALEANVYRGPEGAVKYMGDLDEVFSDTYVDPVSIDSAGPSRVLFEGRVTARGRESGIPVEVKLWSIWEVRDGRIARGTGYATRAEAVQALAAT